MARAMRHYDRGATRPNRGARSGFEGVATPGFGIHYQDPTRPRFVEDRSPIQCRLCGQVPRKPHLLRDGLCVATKACAKRQRGID